MGEFPCHYDSLFAPLYFLLRLLRAVLSSKLLLPFARLTFNCHLFDYWQLVEVVVFLHQEFAGFKLFRLPKNFFRLLGCQISCFSPRKSNHYFSIGFFRIFMASLAWEAALARCWRCASICLIPNLSFASCDWNFSVQSSLMDLVLESLKADWKSGLNSCWCFLSSWLCPLRVCIFSSFLNQSSQFFLLFFQVSARARTYEGLFNWIDLSLDYLPLLDAWVLD